MFSVQFEGGHRGYLNADTGATTRETKSKNLKRITHEWSQFNTLGVSQLNNLFKSKNTQATSRTKEVNLASTRHTEAHELLWRVCCKRQTWPGYRRSAVNRTLFTDELSERNTEIILCKIFFLAAFLVRSFPADLQPRRPV